MFSQVAIKTKSAQSINSKKHRFKNFPLCSEEYSQNYQRRYCIKSAVRANLTRLQSALEPERLAHTMTDAERVAAEARATEQQAKAEQADTERKGLATALEERREQHERERQTWQETASSAEKESQVQIHTLSQSLVKAQATITSQQGQLDTLAREKSNLSTIKDGLSARIEAVLTERGEALAKVSELDAKLSANEDKLSMLRETTEQRLTDNAQLTASLQTQLKTQDKQQQKHRKE